MRGSLGLSCLESSGVVLRCVHALVYPTATTTTRPTERKKTKDGSEVTIATWLKKMGWTVEVKDTRDDEADDEEE